MHKYILALATLGLILTGEKASAQGTPPDPLALATMAPIAQYRIASVKDEIALARSAAAPSISADAEVLVLGSRGYEVAAKGKNGFVCFVERSWAAPFADDEFWNPQERGPNCFNAPAARSELPQYLQRTQWVLAGATKEQIMERTRSAVASHKFKKPEPGSISFMTSKHGHLNHAPGPWLPHVMFFLAHGQAAVWGANQTGSPIIGEDGLPVETTVLVIPVRRWSDGSPAPPPADQSTHTHKM